MSTGTLKDKKKKMRQHITITYYYVSVAGQEFTICTKLALNSQGSPASSSQVLTLEGSHTIPGCKALFTQPVLCPLVINIVFQTKASSSGFSASLVTGLVITQFISLNACGSVALLNIHLTCCIRICCRAVVLKLDCTLETSDMFLRLSVSGCLLTSTDLIM